MKKIIFYISIVFVVILLVNIAQILISDFNRLTQYGFGYLIGKVILLLIFSSIAYFTRISSKK